MKQIICKDCGKSFSISPDEEKFYTSKGLQIPKRCKECRKTRKERKTQEESRRKAEQDEKELRRLVAQFTQKPIEFTNADKSLLIIGNGFDIMHGVKSSYWEFQKTIGKNNPLRWEMETYLDTGDLWSNLEDSLGRLNYSMFLNPHVIDMWLENFGAYDPDCQAADFFCRCGDSNWPHIQHPKGTELQIQEMAKIFKSRERSQTILNAPW